MTKKYMKIVTNLRELYVPLEVIAKNKALYYADLDKKRGLGDTYDQMFQECLEDPYLDDWFLNNMDMCDVMDFVEYEENLPQEENMEYADVCERDLEKELTN